MSCALCSKWQHIPCHNKRDQAAGHPTRNWDSVEFICQRCRAYELDGSGARSMLNPQQRALQPSDTQPSGSFLGEQKGPFHGSYDHLGQSSSTPGHCSFSAANILWTSTGVYAKCSDFFPLSMISHEAHKRQAHIPFTGNDNWRLLQPHQTSLRYRL